LPKCHRIENSARFDPHQSIPRVALASDLFDLDQALASPQEQVERASLEALDEDYRFPNGGFGTQ
jgi:hypothetical protein